MKGIFEAKLSKIGEKTIILLPMESSKELSSRGMVMVEGRIKNISFNVALQPDGKGSH